MKSICLSILLTFYAAVYTFAALPQTINYQGYLKSAGGAPVSVPTTVRFALYSSNPARNNPVWQETKSITPVNGIFSTQLGSATPITANFDVPYHLGIKVASDVEMALQPMTGTGYAFRAGVADSVAPGGSVPGVASWTTTAANTVAATSNSGYLLTGSTPATVSLPTDARVGDVIKVTSQGTGGYTFSLANGQSISGPGIYNDYELWTPRDNYRYWTSITSSADGTKLAAVTFNSQIYTSIDSGVTWTPRENARDWASITSSADGTKLAAVVYNGSTFRSTDSGATWFELKDVNRNWMSVVSSSDGTKLAAVVYGGFIYTSTNSGVTWTARENSRNWASIASSADGTKLAAVANNGQIYTSTDSGTTWTARENARWWACITSSADGTKLAAAAFPGQIYTSTDSGATWTPREISRNWHAITSSSDGTKLAAAVDGGWIYTSGKLSIGSSRPGTVELIYSGNGIWTAIKPDAVAVQGAGIDSANRYIIRADGGVGINHENPDEVLSIGGIGSQSALELGAGQVKQQDAGKIGYKRFSDALDIVGAGTTGTNRKIKFWNEGGATFTGNVGIGTTAAATLDVSGNTNIFGFLSAASATFSGNLGIGKIATAPLDVVGNANVSGSLSADSASFSNSVGIGGDAAVSGNLSFGSATRQMLNLWGAGYGIGVQDYTLYFRSASDFTWYKNGMHDNTRGASGTGGSYLMGLSSSGLAVNGTFVSASDRNAKENFVEVDTASILQKVADLPLSSWNYREDEKKVRHIGPMAQDFFASFGVGPDDKHITTVDADGIALAAIKALKAENDSHKSEIAELKARLERLERLLNTK